MKTDGSVARARRRGRRARRVPRAVRRARVLRPRADARARRGAAPGSRARAGDRHRVEPRGDDLHRRAARRRGEPRPASMRSTRRSSSRTAPSSRVKDGDEDAAILDDVPARPRARRGGVAQSERGRGARLRRAAAGSSPTSPASHHAGGGSHGSLDAGDSEVPMLGVGIEPPARTIDVKDAHAREPALARAVIDARRRMVEQQLAGRDIRDERVLEAMERVPARALRAGGAARAARTTTPRSRSAAGRRSRSRRWSR